MSTFVQYLVQAVRRYGGRIVTDICHRDTNTVCICDIVNDAATVDEEITHVDRGLEIVVGLAAAGATDGVLVGTCRINCNTCCRISGYSI